jgi:hypothetical protein
MYNFFLTESCSKYLGKILDSELSMQQSELGKYYQIQAGSANSYSNLFEQFHGWSAANMQ